MGKIYSFKKCEPATHMKYFPGMSLTKYYIYIFPKSLPHQQNVSSHMRCPPLKFSSPDGLHPKILIPRNLIKKYVQIIKALTRWQCHVEIGYSLTKLFAAYYSGSLWAGVVHVSFVCMWASWLYNLISCVYLLEFVNFSPWYKCICA